MIALDEECGEIWLIPIADIRQHWNPFAAWMEEPISFREIETALEEDRIDERPFDTISISQSEETLRRYHVERIAWMVLHPDARPIEIDIGAPSLGWHPRHHPFDFLDGNHRMCAAIFRGDHSILVTYGGECDAMPDLFPRGIIHAAA